MRHRSTSQCTMKTTHLIELYKATLEELRHQDTVHTQAFLGIGVVALVILAAAGFLLASDSPVVEEYLGHVRIGLLVVAILIAAFCGFTLCRLHKRFEVCIGILRDIEGRLSNAMATGTDEIMLSESELNDLLIRRQFDKIPLEKWLEGKLYGVYVVLGILFLIALGFLLLGGID